MSMRTVGKWVSDAACWLSNLLFKRITGTWAKCSLLSPPKTILVHDCEALKLVFKLLLVVCRYKNVIRYRNNVVTVSKYP